MALDDSKVLAALGALFAGGVALQLLGCYAYGNWWPLLAALCFILVPMPYLFFGAGGSASGLGSGWVDAGKFIVGFTATGTIAIPSLLYHAGKIAHGALWMELAAVAMMGGALAGYDWWSERRGGGGFYSGF